MLSFDAYCGTTRPRRDHSSAAGQHFEALEHCSLESFLIDTSYRGGNFGGRRWKNPPARRVRACSATPSRLARWVEMASCMAPRTLAPTRHGLHDRRYRFHGAHWVDETTSPEGSTQRARRNSLADQNPKGNAKTVDLAIGRRPSAAPPSGVRPRMRRCSRRGNLHSQQRTNFKQWCLPAHNGVRRSPQGGTRWQAASPHGWARLFDGPR